MVVVAFCLALPSTSYFIVLSFCQIFWVCGLFCRLQDPSSSCSVVFPLEGEVGPQACTLIPLIWALIAVIVTHASPKYWGEFPLGSMVVTGLSVWSLIPGLWRRAPRCVSSLWFWSVVKAGRIGGHPLGGKPLRIAPLGLFTLGCAHALCEPHVTACWHCIGPLQPWACWHIALVPAAFTLRDLHPLFVRAERSASSDVIFTRTPA